MIIQWDVADGNMVEGRFAGPPITLRHPYTGGDKAPPVDVRGLDYNEATGMIAVGTCDSDVWEVTDTTQVSTHDDYCCWHVCFNY